MRKSNTFQFKNFAASPELESYASGILERILKLAPAGSSPIAILERVNHGFWAWVEVRTPYGRASAGTFAAYCESALDELYHRIKQKLLRMRGAHGSDSGLRPAM